MLVIYGKENCTFCDNSKKLLDTYGVEYEYVDVVEENLVDWLKGQGHTTVPQIWSNTTENDSHIGGFAELQTWLIDYLN